MPKVHIKQCHLVKKLLKAEYKISTSEALENLDEANYDLKDHINRACRYPLWKEVTLGKGVRLGIPPKEILMLNDEKIKALKVYQRYVSMIEEMERSPLKAYCNNGDVRAGFKGTLSKKYCLGS